MVNVKMGPVIGKKSGNARILVVDDQVFNIEFLRC
jgi:hypothetical protein